jgi:hypothetical protein
MSTIRHEQIRKLVIRLVEHHTRLQARDGAAAICKPAASGCGVPSIQCEHASPRLGAPWRITAANHGDKGLQANGDNKSLGLRDSTDSRFTTSTTLNSASLTTSPLCSPVPLTQLRLQSNPEASGSRFLGTNPARPVLSPLCQAGQGDVNDDEVLD